jgi:hypothetical protein
MKPARGFLILSSRLLFTTSLALALTAAPAWAIKKTPYPEVKVEVADRYAPDPAFEKMRQELVAAVEKKDSAALFALLGPTFGWTFQGAWSDDFDMGRDALHNFKVAFGFRAAGRDQDGGVDDGPYWTSLGAYARSERYYRPSKAGNLVCTPVAATPASERAFQDANQRLGSADDPVEWYFTFAETPVAKAPRDTGAPVAKVGKVALPLLNSHPPGSEDRPGSATHLEVLLPSGKSGWVSAAAAIALVADRLCFAKLPSGDWKIAAYDENVE